MDEPKRDKAAQIRDRIRGSFDAGRVDRVDDADRDVRKDTMKKMLMATLLLALFSAPFTAGAEINPAEYKEATQGELVSKRDAHVGKKTQITGIFQFAGSDFCYQIRKTKINTKDYFCFALGAPSVVRLYLKKSHPQADQLLNLRKGDKVTAFGTFDYMGADYNYMVVDQIAIEKAK